jgi:hypothetical protein
MWKVKDLPSGETSQCDARSAQFGCYQLAVAVGTDFDCAELIPVTGIERDRVVDLVCHDDGVGGRGSLGAVADQRACGSGRSRGHQCATCQHDFPPNVL